MRAVMKSVSPRICEKVASGGCTLLVSKTAPKCDVPFKCYIYCTKSTRAHVFHLYINGGIGRQEFGITGHWRSGKKVVEVNPHLPAYRYNSYLAEGKVIGEFVCDKIEVLFDTNGNPENYMTDILPNILQKTALSFKEFQNYVGSRADKNSIYGLHISDLKIYDKPKELSEFECPCPTSCGNCKNPLYYECWCEEKGVKVLTRAPSNWQYVEEL